MHVQEGMMDISRFPQIIHRILDWIGRETCSIPIRLIHIVYQELRKLLFADLSNDLDVNVSRAVVSSSDSPRLAVLTRPPPRRMSLSAESNLVLWRVNYNQSKTKPSYRVTCII